MRWAIVTIVVAIAGSAHADRQLAERLEKEARTDGDLAKYEACGNAYLAIYNADPKARDADEVVYNAGACFEGARSIGAAIGLYEQLRANFPTSKVTPRALARVGLLYEATGNFALAADRHEEYARKYAAEKDAADALWNAIMLRGVLGDDAKQIAAAELFIKLYGAKRASEAASIAYGLIAVHERRGTAGAIDHLRRTINQFGSKVDKPILVRMYARLGELTWRQSCGVPTIDGLCVKRVRERPLPLAKPPGRQQTATRLRCGPASATVLTAVARNASKAKEAIKALTEARKLVEQHALKDPGAQAVYAHVMTLLADQELEGYLAIGFPTNLDFPPNDQNKRADSTKRFQAYISDKQTRGSKARQQYEAIVSLKDPLEAIAAMTRLGLIPASLSDQLNTGEIPKSVRTGEYAADKTTAYCDTMIEVAEPLLKVAVQTYETCLAKAGEFGISNDSTRICERELAHLAPATPLVTSDMLPAPRLAFAMTDEGPVKPQGHHSTAFRALLDQYAKGAPCPLAETLKQQATSEKLADASYMAGLVYSRCGKRMLARAAYQYALKLDPKAVAARSNLGTLAWADGQRDVAVKHWQGAIAVNAKLFAAHLNMAVTSLYGLRAATDRKRATEDLALHAYTAAVLDGGSPLPHAVLTLAHYETKPELASFHASRAMIQNDRSASVAYAMALGMQHRDDPRAHVWFELAAQPGTLDEASLGLALHYARLRRWTDAQRELGRIKTPSYELAIVRGVVARGLSKPTDAEARYNEAIALDAKRPEAHFNLGVLWKDQATRTTDTAIVKTTLRKAAEAFRRAGTADAKQLAEDCDKALASLP